MKTKNYGQLTCCCGGYGSYRSYGGGREPEPVEYEIRSVNGGPTRFSLAEACAANGLLAGSAGLQSAARSMWDSPESLFNSLSKLGITVETVERLVAEMGAVVIGWEDADQESDSGPTPTVCSDIALTIAVLSRSVGGIFFGGRDPDYSLDNLFGRQLILDEHLPEPAVSESGFGRDQR